MRSRWKGPACFYGARFRPAESATSTVLFRSVLRRKFIEVYNGKKLFYLRLRPFMLGRFIGEYVYCKRFGPSIHKKVDRRKKLYRKGATTPTKVRF
jgi:ribosomal protein S19